MPDVATSDEAAAARPTEPNRGFVLSLVTGSVFAIVLMTASRADDAIPGVGAPAHRLAVLVLGALVILWVGTGRPRDALPTLDALLPLAALALFGFVIAGSGIWGPFGSLEGAPDPTHWLKDLVVVFAVVLGTRTVGDSVRLGWALVGAVTILALPALIQHLTGTYSFEWFGLARTEVNVIDGARRTQIGGPLGGPNPLAQWLATLTPVCIHYAVVSTRARRLFAGAMAVLAVAAVIATQSRQGLLLTVLLLPVAAFQLRSNRRAMALFAVGCLIIGASAFAANPDRWGRQLERIGEVTAIVDSSDIAPTSSAAGYAGTFWAGVDMFSDYPLTGVGHAWFSTSYDSYAAERGIDGSGRSRSAHNVAIHILAEMGLVGAFSFALCVALVARAWKRARDRVVAAGWAEPARFLEALGFALAIWAVSSQFLGLFHFTQMLVVTGVLLALTSATDRAFASSTGAGTTRVGRPPAPRASGVERPAT